MSCRRMSGTGGGWEVARRHEAGTFYAADRDRMQTALFSTTWRAPTDGRTTRLAPVPLGSRACGSTAIEAGPASPGEEGADARP